MKGGKGHLQLLQIRLDMAHDLGVHPFNPPLLKHSFRQGYKAQKVLLYIDITLT